MSPEIVFGVGALNLVGQYARTYEAEKVLVVTDPGVIAAGWAEKTTGGLQQDDCLELLTDTIKFNKDSIKLIILDMIMPVKSGKIAFEEMQQIRPETKVLFCSGYAPDIIQRQGTLTGNFDFLMKPVKPTDLLRKIRELLDT